MEKMDWAGWTSTELAALSFSLTFFGGGSGTAAIDARAAERTARRPRAMPVARPAAPRAARARMWKKEEREEKKSNTLALHFFLLLYTLQSKPASPPATPAFQAQSL